MSQLGLSRRRADLRLSFIGVGPDRMWWIDQVGHAYPFVEAPEVFFPGLRRFLEGDWPEGEEVVSQEP